MKKIVISKGRAESIKTHYLLDKCDFVVPSSQESDYRKTLGSEAEIKVIPDNIMGLGAVRNWVLDNYSDEVIVMLDDDIHYFMSLMNLSPKRIVDPKKIDAILKGAAICAIDAGCTLFSLNQKGDVRKYQLTEPFSLNKWAGTIVGIIGRRFRFNEVNKLKVDADFTLQCLLEERIMWEDSRYSFSCHRNLNTGGNSEFRTKSSVDIEVNYLRNKWGKHIKISNTKGKESLSLQVPRRQRIILNH